MAITIDSTNAHEIEAHQWVAEASSLGLKPGEWPTTLATKLGNGQPFAFHRHVTQDGELISVVYRQGFGILTLTIFND